jgi:dTDP-4-amino-4,6-dideoxygalactose transaminase
VTVPYVDLVAQHRQLRAELLRAVERVLEHGQFILGPEVAELETRLAARLGARHVVTCASGTDALLLALRLRGIGPGDEVITVAHSFVATANAIALTGALPVFVDIDERTMAMDPERAMAAIGPRTRAIIPVHLNGYPVDVTTLRSIAEERGIAVIEDCAQAIGAMRGGRQVGTDGIGCFSLHPLKALSACGDAGFVAVHADEDAATLRRMRNHGLVDRDHCAEVGLNSRLDTLQAALILPKLEHLSAWLQARRDNARRYREDLAGIVQLPPDDEHVEQSYSAFVVRHPERDLLRQLLAARGVDAKVHYPVPIHRQHAYAGRPVQPLPVTERVVRQILSLPVSPELSHEQHRWVVAAVKDAVRQERR